MPSRASRQEFSGQLASSRWAVELTYLAREHVHVVLLPAPDPTSHSSRGSLSGCWSRTSSTRSPIADRRAPATRCTRSGSLPTMYRDRDGGAECARSATAGALRAGQAFHLAAIECRAVMPGAGPVGPSRMVCRAAPFLGALVATAVEAPLFVALPTPARPPFRSSTTSSRAREEYLRAFVSGVSVYAASACSAGSGASEGPRPPSPLLCAHASCLGYLFDECRSRSVHAARGAYQVGAIHALSEMLVVGARPRALPFAYSSGQSAGAITNAFLGARADDFPGAVQHLVALWGTWLHDIFRTDAMTLARVGSAGPRISPGEDGSEPDGGSRSS